MAIQDTRLQRLHVLLSQQKAPRKKNLALLIGKAPAQVSQWFSGARTISEESAREIEVKAKKPPLWLDAPPAGEPDATAEACLPAQPPQARADLVAQLAAALLAAPEAQRDELAQVLALLAKTGSPLYQRRLAELLAAPAPAPTSVSPGKLVA